MINRYEGNTGRVIRMPEPEEQTFPPLPSPMPPMSPPPVPPRRPGRLLPGLDLSRLLPGPAAGLETEDLLLMLILYLLYRESGDEELLIILGAIFLL